MSDSIYSPEFLHHLFYGHVKSKSRGNAKGRKKRVTGLHYISANVIAARGVRVIEGGSSKPDKNGVRLAAVEVKRGGMRAVRQTTLFPGDWTRAQVLEAIREVYFSRPSDHRGRYWGAVTSSGVHITLLLDGAGKIVTAWPKRLKRKKYSPCRLRHSREWRTRLYEREGLDYGRAETQAERRNNTGIYRVCAQG